MALRFTFNRRSRVGLGCRIVRRHDIAATPVVPTASQSLDNDTKRHEESRTDELSHLGDLPGHCSVMTFVNADVPKMSPRS